MAPKGNAISRHNNRQGEYVKELLDRITVKRLHEIILREEPFDITPEEIDLLAATTLKAKRTADEPQEEE